MEEPSEIRSIRQKKCGHGSGEHCGIVSSMRYLLQIWHRTNKISWQYLCIGK